MAQKNTFSYIVFLWVEVRGCLKGILMDSLVKVKGLGKDDWKGNGWEESDSLDNI